MRTWRAVDDCFSSSQERRERDKFFFWEKKIIAGSVDSSWCDTIILFPARTADWLYGFTQSPQGGREE